MMFTIVDCLVVPIQKTEKPQTKHCSFLTNCGWWINEKGIDLGPSHSKHTKWFFYYLANFHEQMIYQILKNFVSPHVLILVTSSLIRSLESQKQFFYFIVTMHVLFLQRVVGWVNHCLYKRKELPWKNCWSHHLECNSACQAASTLIQLLSLSQSMEHQFVLMKLLNHC